MCVCVCVCVSVSVWVSDRERKMRVWLFSINMLKPSEMFPPITVFIMYPAVIPSVCVCARVCVCMLLELRMREVKSIRRLYSPLKLSAFCLCVRLIVQFSILSFSVVFPYSRTSDSPWAHDQFFLLFLLRWLSLCLLFLSLEDQCFMKLEACCSADCRNWLAKITCCSNCWLSVFCYYLLLSESLM